MTRYPVKRHWLESWLLCAGLTLLVAGCSTTPTASFYALNTTEPAGGAVAYPGSAALGPVDMPEYLKRPQIVSRVGGNRLRVDEFNRWGGMLEEEIVRVLTQRLIDVLGTQQVYGYPSRVIAETDHRIALDVRRFDGELGGEVVFDVAWSIIDERNGDVLLTRHATYRQKTGATDYAGYAAALSALVAQLGDDLAATLVGLPSPT